MFSYKLVCLVIFIFIVIVGSKPLEETKSVAADVKLDEVDMMETAESQNPFLPRFAMRVLRERKERAKAQRRNYLAQRRANQPQKPQRIPCYHGYRYYKK